MSDRGPRMWNQKVVCSVCTFIYIIFPLTQLVTTPVNHRTSVSLYSEEGENPTPPTLKKDTLHRNLHPVSLLVLVPRRSPDPFRAESISDWNLFPCLCSYESLVKLNPSYTPTLYWPFHPTLVYCVRCLIPQIGLPLFHGHYKPSFSFCTSISLNVTSYLRTTSWSRTSDEPSDHPTRHPYLHPNPPVWNDLSVSWTDGVDV